MRRHDKGFFWAMRVPDKDGYVRIWHPDQSPIPPEYSLHVLVPMKDYHQLRMGWAEWLKAKRSKGRKR